MNAVRQFALLTAALATPGVAQFSLDAVLLTDIVSRAELLGSTPVVETFPAGPIGLGLTNSNVLAQSGDSSAYTNTTFLLTESATSVDARIETFFRAEGPQVARMEIAEFELLLRFHTPPATLVRITADAEYHEDRAMIGLPTALRTTRIDALNDGTIESSDLESAPYTSVFSSASGLTTVRVLPSMIAPFQRETLGRAIIRIKLETVDGCEVSQVTEGCRPATGSFVTERLLDGSIRAALSPSAPTAPAATALVLGFSSNPVALPPSLAFGFSDCYFVPTPDVVLAFDSNGEFRLPPPAAFAPIEIYLQPIGLDPVIVLPSGNANLLVLDSYRVACF